MQFRENKDLTDTEEINKALAHGQNEYQVSIGVNGGGEMQYIYCVKVIFSPACILVKSIYQRRSKH